MDARLLGCVHLLSLEMILVGYNPSGDPRSIKATVRTDHVSKKSVDTKPPFPYAMAGDAKVVDVNSIAQPEPQFSQGN